MKQEIPERIKLFKFASRSLNFSHAYSAKDFPRIQSLTSNNDALIDVELAFSLEKDNIPCIKGKVKVDMALTCQRCLGVLKLCLQPSFQLAFLQNRHQAEALDASFETILNVDEEFSTIEFITDEVLIAMPMIPLHDYACVAHVDTQSTNQQKRENPFAILAQYKNKE